MKKLSTKGNGYEVREGLIELGYDEIVVEDWMDSYDGPMYWYLEDYIWLIDGYIERMELEANKPDGIE